MILDGIMTDHVTHALDDLVVSIINYRTANLTIGCVASVLEYFEAYGGKRGHVVVVDNASGDSLVESQ